MEHIYITRLNSSTFVKRIEKNTVLSDYVFDDFTTISCEYKKAHLGFQEYKFNKFNIEKNYLPDKINELFDIVIIYDIISDGYVVMTTDYKYSYIIQKMLTISNNTSCHNTLGICKPTSAMNTYKNISLSKHMNTYHPFKTFCMESKFAKFFSEEYNYFNYVFEITSEESLYIFNSQYKYFTSLLHKMLEKPKQNHKNRKSEPRKMFDLNDSYTYSCKDYFTNINNKPNNKMQFKINRNIIWTRFPYYITIYKCPLGKERCLIQAKTIETCKSIHQNIIHKAKEFLIQNKNDEDKILIKENKALLKDSIKMKLFDEKIYIANFNKNYNHIRLFGNENPTYNIINAKMVMRTEKLAGIVMRQKILQYRILSKLKEPCHNHTKQSYPVLLSKV